MIQYVLAKSLALRVGGMEICGYDMPDWKLRAPVPPTLARRGVRLRANLIDLEDIARRVTDHMGSFLELVGNGQRCECFAPAHALAHDFQGPANAPEGLGDDRLIIHVRAGDIVGTNKKEYGLLAPEFYDELIQRTGRQPAFIGELDDGPYVNALRARFGEASFLKSRGIIGDFETLRRSAHIALSASTFAWAAAWLSNAKTIHLPVVGLFDPRTRPDINLLPLGDPRYVFYDLVGDDWFGGRAPLAGVTAGSRIEVIQQGQARALLSAARRRLRGHWSIARARFRLEMVMQRLTA